jgi:GAF domain-containing protein
MGDLMADQRESCEGMSAATEIEKRQRSYLLIGFVLLLAVLYLAYLYRYNLFHSLAELFSVAVAFAVFAIAWHTRKFAKNEFLLFLGATLAAVAVTDTLHLLAYKGMGVFPDRGANLATQLWVVGRYEFALAFLLAPLLLTAARWKSGVAFGLFAAAWTGLLLSVFAWPVFPVALIDGEGLTPFKRVSEYVVCVLLLAAFWLLHRHRQRFESRIFWLLSAAILVAIVSELCFTLYVDPYGFLNLLGHFLKIVAFFLLYLAIVERTLVAPYSLLFRGLRQREQEREELLARLDGVGQVTEAAMQSLEIHKLMQSVLARVVPLMKAQAAVILRVQGDNLVAVASKGLEEDLRESFSLPMGAGIAGWVAETRQPLYIGDAQNDPRVVSPVLVSRGIRSVMAVPLLYGEELLGVMHVDWTETTAVPTADLRFLELLADRVAVALSNADLYARQKEVAEILQTEMLALPALIPGLSFGHVYRSASQGAHVGGDFYDIFDDDDSRAWFLIGDVSGHGVRAATAALLIREVTRAFAVETRAPSDVLTHVNRAVVQRLGLRHYATLCLAVLDLTTRRLQYSSAGHPPGYVLRNDGTVAELVLPNLPIGAFREVTYYSEEISFGTGEILALYTDGVTEARRGREFFGESRLIEIIRRASSAESLPQEILTSVEEFSGGRSTDDLAVLCVSS